MNLAINGGTKAIPNPIGSAWPIWDDTEKTALLDVLESGRWGMAGWDFHRLPESKLVQFEQAFARYHDQEYGLAVSTGTVALEAALVALGVEVGDEVIVPAATYIASAACVARVNAIPILVDIDPATYTISPAAVEAAITSRTVAIIAVDLGGMPADTEVLRQIADRHGIALVSDCSHAQGSAFKGKKAGAWADISAYSIMSAKTFAVGEGGVICSNDADLIERCKSYQHMGRTPGAVSPDHVYPATTIRLSEWEAAIGLCALTRIEDQAQQRNHNVRYLGRQMDEMPGVKGLDIPNEVGVWNPYRWHFKFVPDEWDGVNRDQFQTAMTAEGIPMGIGVTKPLYWFSYFRSGKWGPGGFPFHSSYNPRQINYRDISCPETERIHLTESLDISHKYFLGDVADMDQILNAITKLRDNMDELRSIDVKRVMHPDATSEAA